MNTELIPANSSIEFYVSAWLNEKYGRSRSEKTRRAYEDTLHAFQDVCRAAGYSLDGDSRAVGLLLQAFCDAEGKVSPATHNQRLAIVSSFYRYAIRYGFLSTNPAQFVTRRPVQKFVGAVPLETGAVADGLALIDRSTLAGRRDYALLLIALTTGRRVSEIANLTWEDVRDGVLTFHGKGGKIHRHKLPNAASEALQAYTRILNDDEFCAIGSLWRSFAHNDSFGKPLGAQALEAICKKHLGTSKFHALRHTFAHAMRTVGADVVDIQAQLGHENLATTGVYLKTLGQAENKHADAVANLFI